MPFEDAERTMQFKQFQKIIKNEKIDEQVPLKERLGQHLRNLSASNAYYVDVTHNKGVRSEHSYFKGKSVKENSTLKKIFSQIFEGGKAEQLLEYHVFLALKRLNQYVFANLNG